MRGVATFIEHPELGNRETRTAKIVADHLRGLGIEVRAGVAHTGVVGVLRGGKPGKVVALRADMDGLPVTEQVNLPFASKVKATYNGQEVGVMHACGHDNHVAILMGVAEIFAGMKDQLAGTVKFIFQPAEEGAPAGEEGGAALMIKEGAFDNPKPDAVFGLHVWGGHNVGHIGYRAGGMMASSDHAPDHRQGKANARRCTLGGRGSDCRELADCARTSNDREPSDRHHQVTLHHYDRQLPRRRSVQHHPR